MEHSILDSVKKNLGLTEDYDVFDHDILTHINSVFSTLHQMGIGPVSGFFVEDATPTWSSFLGTDQNGVLNAVKSYMYLRVRMLFDPPGTGYLITAFEKQIQELEWRLTAAAEDVVRLPEVPVVLDGGEA